MTTAAEHGPERFDGFLDELVAWARDEPGVIGVVGMGSTGARGRADEWSDHDFAVVTEAGEQERLRQDLAWLPGAERLVVAAREHHDGFKAFDLTGHVLEFAVVDRDELLTFAANDYEVLYDVGDVGAWMRLVRARTVEGLRYRPGVSDVTVAGVLLAQLLIGVGRVRRGEVLSGAQIIRSEAEASLLDLIGRRRPAAAGAARDDLDARRRFERSYPVEAALVARALEREAEAAAEALLGVAEDVLAPGWPEFPAEGVTVLRRRLGWASPSPSARSSAHGTARVLGGDISTKEHST